MRVPKTIAALLTASDCGACVLRAQLRIGSREREVKFFTQHGTRDAKPENMLPRTLYIVFTPCLHEGRISPRDPIITWWNGRRIRWEIKEWLTPCMDSLQSGINYPGVEGVDDQYGSNMIPESPIYSPNSLPYSPTRAVYTPSSPT